MAKTQKKESPEAKKKNKGKRRLCYWGSLFLLWGLNIWWNTYPPSPELVEHVYTRGLYRWMVALITPLTAPVNFPLALILVVGILLGFPLIWFLRARYLVRKKGASRWRALCFGPKWLLILLPLLNAWFLLFWGAGYLRPPVEHRLSLDTKKIGQEESEALRARLLEMVERDQPKTPQDRNIDRALASVSTAMAAVIEEWDGVPITLPAGVKATPKGLLLLNGTSGICAPFTLEPNVDGGLPDTTFVSVAAHELSHVAGICSEAEANLASYVAGLRAEDPFARYAVALRLYYSFARQLPRDQMIAAMKRLPDVAKADLKAASEAHKRYQIDIVQKYSWKVYDSYLKKQGIQEGVKNYARGTALFVFCWRKGLVQFAGPVGDGAPAE